MNQERLFCPQCTVESKTSSVREGVSSTTAMWYAPFYDDDGDYHVHDMNYTTTEYTCSNGHQFNVNSSHPCPNTNCNWGKE